MIGFVLLAILAASAVAEPVRLANERIIAGSVTSIHEFPFLAAVLYSSDLVTYSQTCGGSILNIRSILTAASCFGSSPTTSQWRVRVGSTWANDGGVIHNTASIINHPDYNENTYENDISLMHLSPFINYLEHTVERIAIANENYWMADGTELTAVGWGASSIGGETTEHLQTVTVNTINQDTCTTRYSELDFDVTDAMLCSGILNEGGKDTCDGDNGGPLLHVNAGIISVVAVYIYAYECGSDYYPSINTKVSNYTTWIVNNA